MAGAGALEAVPEIRKLDEEVVSRITAGEVVQRPVSALKELMENSLDAGATSITVTVKEGGVKLLQIQDNGHGIREADLPILCERHTTSKLRTFEDLQSISTLGFRGEALSSISFVSHLSITTCTKGAAHGLRTCYRDGAISEGPSVCAAMQGTTVCAEDLFYNVPTRLRALGSAADEYARILDITSRYAVFKPSVSFTCKRQGSARSDIHTLPGSTREANIRLIYGGAVAKDLIAFDASSSPDGPSAGPLDDAGASFAAEGLMSGVNYTRKKTVLILFINGRPVECSPLKRAIEGMYQTILPKGSRPFVFLSLEVPPQHVDVNVHPTKREVALLGQDALVEEIVAVMEAKLLAANTSRAIDSSAQVPLKQSAATQPDKRGRAEGADKAKAPAPGPKYEPHKLVRTDARAQTLEAFIQTPSSAAVEAAAGASRVKRRRGAAGAVIADERAAGDVAREEAGGAQEQRQVLGEIRSAVRQRRTAGGATNLASVQDLLQEAEARKHAGLAEIVRENTFVGLVEPSLALLQHKTKLLLVDMAALTKDMFYQQVLRRWEHFGRIRLREPANIEEAVHMALEYEEAAGRWHEEGEATKATISRLARDVLVERREMLEEYLAMDIDADGNLRTLPLLIEQYTPEMSRLPLLLLKLATEVDWSEEKECFRSLATVLAGFYAVREPLVAPQGAQDWRDSGREWEVQHIVLPAMRLFLTPGRERSKDSSVIEVAALERLYRVFERC
ncbi:unnamed protein product [Pedinophyceae sp. YPF-701]|nr:unnamed protein product [Pedinophyceae sp. YPF-701]